MNQSHSYEKWNDSQEHDAIFGEYPFSPNISSTDAKEDERDCIYCTPPTDKKCRFIVSEGPKLRSFTRKTSKQLHNVWL